MTNLTEILADSTACGLYLLKGALKIPDLERIAKQHGMAFFTLHGTQTGNKEEFLAHASAVLGFPDYFGMNWDAFADCLTDLSWMEANRILVLYADSQVFAERSPLYFKTALEIFRESSEFWRQEKRGFLVLLHSTTDLHVHLPTVNLE